MSEKSDHKKQEEQEMMDWLRGKAEEIQDSEIVKKNRKVTSEVGRDVLFFEQLEASLSRALSGKFATPKKVQHKNTKTKRILNLVLSDLHYGSDLDPREVGVAYGPIEEARRTAAVIKEVAEYKMDHRHDTELYVHLAGDILNGTIHREGTITPLAEQMGRATHILTQAMGYLAANFKKVSVFTAIGNHDRAPITHPTRAINQKWNSYGMSIYHTIMLVCKQWSNVKVNLTYEPKADFPLFGHLGFLTHLDTVLNVGMPAKSINVGNAKKQMNEINNARIGAKKQPYNIFVGGHCHTPSLTHLSGNMALLTNGSLIPADPYSISLGIFESVNGQYLFESTPEHYIGDSRFIIVNGETDKDSSLDQIIKPFEDLTK